MLGKIIVDDQRIFTGITIVLTNRASRVGRNKLHGGRVCSTGRHHGRVLHGAIFFQGAHNVGDGRHLLADGHIDALNTAALLVDNGVDSNRGLTNLAVANNQLSLAASYGHHGVNTFEAKLYGLIHGLASDNTRRYFFNR